MAITIDLTYTHKVKLSLTLLVAIPLRTLLALSDMDLSLLLAITVCPAMLGVQEAIRQSQSKNKREEHRARRCNLVVQCVRASIRRADVDGHLVVLRDGRLFVETPALGVSSPPEAPLHAFAGYFLPYPDTAYEGLVSTISDTPPVLNWIYVDARTHQVRHGIRDRAQPNVTGPFDCTAQDRRLSLEGWEGFCVVEETPGVWALYFDRDDDGLRAKVPMGTRVLEVTLERREKKVAAPVPTPDAATSLAAKMAELKRQANQPAAMPAERASPVSVAAAADDDDVASFYSLPSAYLVEDEIEAQSKPLFDPGSPEESSPPPSRSGFARTAPPGSVFSEQCAQATTPATSVGAGMRRRRGRSASRGRDGGRSRDVSRGFVGRQYRAPYVEVEEGFF